MSLVVGFAWYMKRVGCSKDGFLVYIPVSKRMANSISPQVTLSREEIYGMIE